MAWLNKPDDASGMTSSLPKPPFRRENLADISYASRVIANFVPNFVAMATGGQSGKNAIGIIRWPIPENPPYRRNNHAKISYASRVIANFVPNFVATATGVGRE